MQSIHGANIVLYLFVGTKTVVASRIAQTLFLRHLHDCVCCLINIREHPFNLKGEGAMHVFFGVRIFFSAL